ncbi:hypothetical protein Fot_28526 [Forsythia ovata]|uniref:Uncharacterized protein n=1 Tax=Forsythia ovata TaxID=205694 RepID=A0ABD1TP91_9LAMI
MIKDELPDINFNFLHEEGETTTLVFPLEVDNEETVMGLIPFEVLLTFKAMVELTNGNRPSKASAEPTSYEAVLEPTAGTSPTQVEDTIVFGNLQVHVVPDGNFNLLFLDLFHYNTYNSSA